MVFFKIKNLLLLTIGLTVISCGRIEKLVSNKTDREKYLGSLEKSGLTEREVVKMWIQDFNLALQSPMAIQIPYSEQIVYPVGATRADAFLIDVPAGRMLEVNLQKVEGRGMMFMEGRSVRDSKEKVGNVDSSFMEIEAESHDRQLIIILQPELMSYGKWDFRISHHPSISFPVEGKSEAAIQSFFGAPRDGGKRLHHGIDIFADRGTAVLAVSNGWIYRTAESKLGGKVVWLNSDLGSVYYAHLDSINVKSPSRVKEGDTLGFVGNTGNARSTPPHLHFGIYKKGAINPLGFVAESKFPEAPHPFQDSFTSYRTIGSANFRHRASMTSAIKSQLEKGKAVWVYGKSGDWLRVGSSEGDGYLHYTLVESIGENELKLHFPTKQIKY